MRKKITLFMIAVTVLCSALALFSACTPNTDPDDGGGKDEDEVCEHVWERTGEVSGTCITYGRTDYRCTLCGETKSEYGTTYNAHNYANHVCTVCGKRQDGEKQWESGDNTVYLYVVTSSVTGDKTYNLLVAGSGKTADFTEGKQPWAEYLSQIIRVEVTEGVTGIGDNFAAGCNNLIDVSLASTLTEIGDYAFNGCTALNNVQIGDNLTTVGKGAFRNCSKITELLFPSSAYNIGYGALEGCSVLRTLSIAMPGTTGGDTDKSRFFGSLFGDGNGAQTVTAGGSAYSFNVPSSLATLEIKGDGIIGDYAFNSCTSLQKITVSGGVTEIGQEAFSKMTNLVSVTFTQDTLTSIGAYAFAWNGMLGSESTNPETGQTIYNTFIIPASVTFLGEGAFSSCAKLARAEFAGDEGLTELPVLAFGYCAMLKTVKLPLSLIRVGQEAFRNTGLTEIRLGPNVEVVGKDAFGSCTNLSTVYVDSENIYAGAADDSGLFNQAKSVYVLESVVPEGTEKEQGTSYIKKNFNYKGLDPNGYHLWER